MTARWVAQIDTPVGLVTVETTENTIAAIRVGDAKRTATPDAPAIVKRCMQQLQEYFSGSRSSFDLPLALEGTPFQKHVWETTRHVGYGATMTYGSIASAIGKDGAARAVGNALNKNPVWIVVPCHRIVGSTPQSGGYAGGMERKTWLLTHERSAA